MSVANARRILPQLEHLNLLFAEEPLLPEHMHLLSQVVAATTVPVALGERLYGRAEFLAALDAGLAVAQPDLSHAGGITEVRKIASLADTYNGLLAPHCPLGPLALAASLQIAFTTPNFLIQEQSIGLHYNAGAELLDYVLDVAPFAFVDGAAALPTRPGLGVDIDEPAVRRADRSPHYWRNPVWRHDDGSRAEW
jgi:galactonate dehydratase